jgi:hypothetical protein
MNLWVVPRYNVFARLPFVLPEQQVRQAAQALIGLARFFSDQENAQNANPQPTLKGDGGRSCTPRNDV